MAATRVEAEIIESSVASSPEFTSDIELTFLPTDLTYRPKRNLTKTARPMMKTIAKLREKYDLHMTIERFISDETIPKQDKAFIRK